MIFDTPRGRSSTSPAPRPSPPSLASRPPESEAPRRGAPRESFAAEISDPRRIHAQLDRLAARVQGRRLDQLVQEGVRFTQLVTERDATVARVRAAIADGSYRPGQAQLAHSYIHGKWREIARLGPLDLIVHGVLAEVLGERLEERLSPRVYSYRVKRSPWHALRWLARVATVHRRRRPDPRARGIFVLRADIKSYAPTIPLHPESAIWPQLREVCGVDEASPHWKMLHAMVVQELLTKEGEQVSRERGVLFGAPTSNALMNLYLVPLDDALVGLRGGYARFGDDILFAHVDADLVMQAKATMERVLADRLLEANPTKVQVFFWNGAARRAEARPELPGVSSLPFLGGAVNFDGTIAIAPAKWRLTLRDLRARIRRTARLMEAASPEERASVLAGVVNEAFDVRSELGLSYRQMLGDLVSDRDQLGQLDYWIALWVAEAATGARGPMAFRRLPYRWLRREAGLVSRVAARNAGER